MALEWSKRLRLMKKRKTRIEIASIEIITHTHTLTHTHALYQQPYETFSPYFASASHSR